jgi:hypothetical protein
MYEDYNDFDSYKLVVNLSNLPDYLLEDADIFRKIKALINQIINMTYGTKNSETLNFMRIYSEIITYNRYINEEIKNVVLDVMAKYLNNITEGNVEKNNDNPIESLFQLFIDKNLNIMEKKLWLNIKEASENFSEKEKKEEEFINILKKIQYLAEHPDSIGI